MQQLLDLGVSHFAIHSAHVKKGSCFFALKGEKQDGHLFLEEAISNGAVCAFVDKDYKGSLSIPLFRVDDVLLTLQTLAKNHLQSINPYLIAITGSSGKTTTKEFLREILLPYFQVASSEGNQNSQIGLPLSILNHLKNHHTHFIAEMGMSGFSQIKNLVQIAPPDYAIITSISVNHLAFFTDPSDIARAKAEIFSHPKTKKGLVHSSFFTHKVDLPSHVTYREFSSGRQGLPLVAHWPDFFYGNFLAAAYLASDLGVPWKAIINKINAMPSCSHRFSITSWEGITVIDDTYNAGVNAIEGALDFLKEQNKNYRTIAFLGSMAELGEWSDAYHMQIYNKANQCADRVFLLGQGWPEECRKKTNWSLDKNHLWEEFLKEKTPRDFLLLKGANFHALWTLIAVPVVL